MKPTSLDVVGLGNAIVDVIAHADDAFPFDRATIESGMLLVEAGAEELYRSMGSTIVSSGSQERAERARSLSRCCVPDRRAGASHVLG